MQKNALAISVSTLVMGIFGAFLRWLQNRTIFEETGLAIPRAGISYIYVVYSLLALAGILGITLFGLRRYAAPTEPAAALHASTVIPIALAWVVCAVFMLSGIALMFSAGASAFPGVQRLFGAAAVVAGACFPFLPCRRWGEINAMGRQAAFYLPLFFCFWIAFCYLSNAQNPERWIYVPELLAVVADTVAIYEISSWFYGRAKPAAALAAVQLAVFLDLCTLSDARSRGLTAMLAASAAILLTLEYVLLENMAEPE